MTGYSNSPKILKGGIVLIDAESGRCCASFRWDQWGWDQWWDQWGWDQWWDQWDQTRFDS